MIDLDIVKELVSKKNVNARSNDGKTALSQTTNSKINELLVQHGAKE